MCTYITFEVIADSLVDFIKIKGFAKTGHWSNTRMSYVPQPHLITTLDGKTLSNATKLEIDRAFYKIILGEPLIHLSDDVIQDLSTDQAYGF